MVCRFRQKCENNKKLSSVKAFFPQHLKCSDMAAAVPWLMFQINHFKDQKKGPVSLKRQKEKVNPIHFQLFSFFLSAKVIKTRMFPRRFFLRRFLFQCKTFHQNFLRRGWESQEERKGMEEGTENGQSPW